MHGAIPLIDGVYAGGIDSCTKLVQSGRADPHEFRLLSGYVGWAPGALDREVASGTWWVASVSPKIIQTIIDGKSLLNSHATNIVSTS